MKQNEGIKIKKRQPPKTLALKKQGVPESNELSEINEVDPSIKEYIDETITAELDRILELSGISEDMRRNIAERGRASMGGGPGHRDPTFTSTAPGHAGSYGGGPESGPGDEEYGVRSRPKKWGTDYQAAMAKRQRERSERNADGGGPEGASNIPAKASVPQKGPWTKTKPVFTKAKRQTGRDE